MIFTPWTCRAAFVSFFSHRRSSRRLNRFRMPAWCSATAMLACYATTVLSAQAVGGNFGPVNVGATSSVTPLTFTFETSDTLASTQVLTLGVAGLDFADAGSDTCIQNTSYTAGQSCTVNVTFTPRFAGNRFGAVVLQDSAGNTMATGYLLGIGIGPQIAFQPAVQSELGSGFSEPASIAVDGNGDLFVTNVGSSTLYEMVAVNGEVPASPTIKTIGSGFGSIAFVTIDARGNLYVGDTENNAVKEVLAVNGSIPASPTLRTLGSGFSEPAGVAVDSNGDVYVANLGGNSVEEIEAVNGTIPASPTIQQIGSGFKQPIGVAVDATGNVYVADSGNSAVKEVAAGNGAITTLGSGFDDPYSIAIDDSGNVYVADTGNSAVKEIVAVNGSIPASPIILKLGSGFNEPGGVAVDAGFNVYVADTENARVEMLDIADPPSLAFASTAIGSVSSDSPRTVTILNAGNAALSFPIPSAGNNPYIAMNPPGGAANFTLNNSGASACPLLTSSSSEPAILAAGQSCQLPVSFAPSATGVLSGFLVLTDNNLNAAGPDYSEQDIRLSGTGTGSFTLANSASSLTMTQGGSGAATITVTDQNGFTGSVTLSASGLPSGVTASFSPNPTTGTSVLTVTASSTSSLATNQAVTITGTSGSLTASTTVLLTITPANFTLSSSTTSMVVYQGASGAATITVNDENSFTGNVTLSASGLPSGVTASFSPNPTAATSVLTLSASSSTAAGTYYVSATGSSGAEVAATPSITLYVVQPAFTVFAGPTALTLPPSSSVQTSIDILGETGITGNISLTASPLPNGVTASFSVDPVSPTGSSVLTFSANSSVSPGTYTVTITGTGPSSIGSLSETATVYVTVPPPAFALTSSVGSSGMVQGTSLNSTITVLPQYGFAGSVTLTATGLPTGVTATFSQNPTTATSVLTMTVADTAPPVGNALITITGTSGTLTATTSIDIGIVAATPTFSLSTAPESIVLAQGSSSTSTVSVTWLNFLSANVYLTAYGLPAGVTASFSPNPTTGTSVVTLTASSSAATGSYGFGIGGGLSQGLLAENTGLNLTVIPLPGFSPSSANFGAVNIGAASQAQTLTYTFGAPVTLGSTAVLTQGALGLDFGDAGSDTCTPNTSYAVGQSCTVNVAFTPEFAGAREGTVAFYDTNGNVIAAAYLQGSGLGPQLAFFPGTQTTLGSSFDFAAGDAVDGNGNAYVVDVINNVGNVQEIMAVNGTIAANPTIQTLAGGLDCPTGPALDAAGDVYFGDVCNHTVSEIRAVNGSMPSSPVVTTLTSQFVSPVGIAVDGSGNVYVLDASNDTVNEIYAVNGSIPASPTIATLASGFKEVDGIAVDGNGDVYVSDDTSHEVFEIQAVNGGIPASPTITALGSGFVTPRGLAVDVLGNVYVAEYYYGTVYELLAVNGSIPASPAILTLATGLLNANGVALEGNRNVFVADYGDARLVRLDYADPPSLTFASTAVGSTSSDSPQLVTVENVGNATLTFPIPSAGNNPSIGPDFTLNGSAPNACAVISNGSSAAGTLAAGASCALSIGFAPTAAGSLNEPLVLTDSNLNSAAPAYSTQSIQLNGTGLAATPSITWAAPAAINYGTALSAAQLDATASVSGTFNYSPAAGTVLGAGTQTLTVTFTPTNSTNYTAATATVALTVNQATPTITWNTPAAIPYGTALGASQLDATSTVAGSFSYSPAAGVVLTAGTHSLSATFTPTDTVDYTTATAAVTLTINQAAPTITWSAPAAITYGTVLGASQLDATANVAGSFSYSPAAGAVLAAGTQTLTVTFTPTDTTDYTAANASVSLTVNKATPTVTWPAPSAIVYGTALSATQLDATANVAGSFSYSPAAGAVLAAGTQTLSVTFTPTNGTDYAAVTTSASLTVKQATPTITWATPAAITYGTALSGMQLDARASVAGSFAYSPAAGTVLAAGSETLSVTFAPTNFTDYSAATDSVVLTVNKATPTISIKNIPTSAVEGGSFTPAYSYSGNGSPTESVTSSTTKICTVSSGVVHFVGTGTCTLAASATATTDYTAVTGGSQSFSVER